MSSSSGSWKGKQSQNNTRKPISESRVPNESGSKYSFNDDNIVSLNEDESGNFARTNFPIREENESQEDTSREPRVPTKPDP